jgi:hypothetical protein
VVGESGKKRQKKLGFLLATVTTTGNGRLGKESFLANIGI